MNFENFINQHWNVFLVNICCYYPLEKEFLEKYQFELEWNSISKNQNIQWSEEILETFQAWLKWHELAWNPSILWTSDLIKRFRNRLDWYYLSRNVNLPISKAFIEEYRKDIFITENNHYLTQELIEFYGKNLLSDNISLQKKITNFNLHQLEAILGKHNNEFNSPYLPLYNDYILPHLNTINIHEIFERKFPYNQRYFKLKPIENDIYGLVAKYCFEDNSLVPMFKKIVPKNEDIQIISLKKDVLQEGKDRLYETVSLKEYFNKPVFIGSENVKNILQQFNSSDIKFYPVSFKNPNLKVKGQYFMILMEHDSVHQLIDLDTVPFYYQYSNEWHEPLSEPIKIEKKLCSIEDIYITDHNSSAKRLIFYPESYTLYRNFDIFSIKNDIIVNEFVKKILEEQLPQQLTFESAEIYNIRINQADYDKKRKQSFNINRKIIETEISSEKVFLYEKMDRLKNTSSNFCPKSTFKDELAEFENTNNILFPEGFRDFYFNQSKISDFQLLSICDFYFDDEYQDTYPETYKALIIAKNEFGDSIGLILKRESDYQLDNVLIAFSHETGEIQALTKIEFQSSEKVKTKKYLKNIMNTIKMLFKK